MVISLTGFMGSGKTTVGKVLSELLGVRFVDLDEYVEHKAGKSIPEIFLDSESRFRAIEAEAVRDLIVMSFVQDEDLVLSLGGGTFTIEPIRKLILEQTESVFLKTPLDVILQRLEGETSGRPLLSTRDIRSLLEERIPLYEQAAFTVETEKKSPAEIAGEISKINFRTR